MDKEEINVSISLAREEEGWKKGICLLICPL